MVTSFSSYTGGEFLSFYIALMVAAIYAGASLPNFLRPEGREQRVTDMGELAWLAGGPKRFAEAVLARLYGIGALNEVGRTKLGVVRAAAGRNAAERALLRGSPELDFKQAQDILQFHAEDVETQLVKQGLVLSQRERLSLRLAGLAPYIFILLVGLYRRQAGQALDEPVGLLTLLMFRTIIFAVIRYFVFDLRTRAGQNAIERAMESSKRLSSAATGPELGTAVAIFGTIILVGTPFQTLHAMRQTHSGDGGGSSDGGSSDGGCGGGGCGGCGG